MPAFHSYLKEDQITVCKMLIASVSVPQQNESVVVLEISMETVAYREGEKSTHGNVSVELKVSKRFKQKTSLFSI